jgi:hypothetical protein
MVDALDLDVLEGEFYMQGFFIWFPFLQASSASFNVSAKLMKQEELRPLYLA